MSLAGPIGLSLPVLGTLLAASGHIPRSVAAQEWQFSLLIEGPATLHAGPDGVARGRFTCILEQKALRLQRVTGWSLAIEGRGLSKVTPTTSRTFLDLHPDASVIEKSVSENGKEGAICRVTLPAPTLVERETVLHLDVEMQVDFPGGSPGWLTAAQFWDSNVLVRSVAYKEDGAETHILVGGAITAGYPEEVCGKALLGFSLSNVGSRVPFAEVLGGPGGKATTILRAEEGERSRTKVYAALMTIVNPLFDDVCGWSLSIVLDGDAVPAGVSYAQSAGGKYMKGGLQITRMVDPSLNQGKQGFVSAIVLTLSEECEIPLLGTTAVLEMEIEEASPHGLEDTEARLRFEDGLVGGGAPVPNLVTIRGESVVPCNKDSAALTVVFSLAGERFLRGDTNGDGRVNISDAIFTLGELFRGAAGARCPASSDANADRLVDISDAIYILAHLFQGGPSPTEPFPDCGPDPVDDEVSLPCLELPPGCG